jgi:hypothetical protein
LTVSSIGGAGTVAAINFSISGEPGNSTITFSPQPLPTGSGTTAVTLTIHTPDYPVGAQASLRASKAVLALMVIGGLLLPFGRRRRMPGSVTMLLLALMAGAALSGCGSGWGRQQFTISITGSSGLLSHTATATLISQ